MSRYVYHFEPGAAEGTASMRRLLGLKGANLAEMARMGLAVPPGMTITTEACSHYLRHRELPPGLRMEIEEGLAQLQAVTQRNWGLGKRPLLLSARSGGVESMPGMMESVLNLGLTTEVMQEWIEQGEEDRFVYDCRRRLVQMYARTVFGVDDEALKECRRRIDDGSTGESAARHRSVAEAIERLVWRRVHATVPDDPTEQMWGAVRAIFDSWDARRPRNYRKLHGISDEPGTAVTLMAMVYGNRGSRSCSGIGFTRHPITGEPRAYGEYLARRQGDDVAEGKATPKPVRRNDRSAPTAVSMETSMPGVCAELVEGFHQLEHHFGTVQEVEFTVESGKVWFLQTRRATRTGPAAVRMAMDMLDEGMLDEKETVLRVDPKRHLSELLGRRIDPDDERLSSLIAGVGASPGAAFGRLVTRPQEAVERARRGESVVLMQSTTRFDDVEILGLVEAIVTTEGGVTAHLAEASRKLGLPCVCGVRDVTIAEDGSGIDVHGRLVSRGQMITVDGTGGRIYEGAIDLIEGPDDDEVLAQFLGLVDRFRRMKVRVDADELEGVERGLERGADGVGMCRTDEMILSTPRRVTAMRRLLLSGDEDAQRQALAELLDVHRHDMAQILRFVDGRPLAVCLLDAPLRAFLPPRQESGATGWALEIEADELERRVESLDEDEPKLGLRGARLGLVMPEIYEMQVQAIVEAARMVVDEGIAPSVELLIPRICDGREAQAIVEQVETSIARHLHGATERIHLDVGLMVQFPRAALVCDALAGVVDRVVFATEELTRWCWGMAPEQARRYLSTYLTRGLVDASPFDVIDRRGVLDLIRGAIWRGRSRRRDLVVEVDAGHGGEPSSIRQFEAMDVDAVTVNPDDVMATRLACAQAHILDERARRQRQEREVSDE